MRVDNAVVLAFAVFVCIFLLGGLSVFCFNPGLRRRQFSRIILMQLVADTIWSLQEILFILVTPECGFTLNKYGMTAVVYSSCWVCVFAFHTLAQASGRWIEAERYGPKYHAFSIIITAAFFFAAVSGTGWSLNPCFADSSGGKRLNDHLAITFVFGTLLCGCAVYAYIRLVLRKRLYTMRFIGAYIVCWSGTISWFIAQASNPEADYLRNVGWNTFNGVSLLMLGPVNLYLYAMMPPDYIFFWIWHRILGRRRDQIRALRYGSKLSTRSRGYTDDLKERLIFAEDNLWDTSVSSESGNYSTRASVNVPLLVFDAASENYLRHLARKYVGSHETRQSQELILQPSMLIIGDQIGKGAFGAVHTGTYRNTPVAIKEMHTVLEVGFDYGVEKALRDFFSEAIMLRQARHKNLVNFIGLSMGSQGRLLLVMELYENSLVDVLKNTPLHTKNSVRLRYCADIMRGIAYLHSLHIVHRDIKPDNVLVDARGAKVGDLGAASCLMALEETEEVGTPLYLAPEAFSIQQRNLDDLFTGNDHRVALPVRGTNATAQILASVDIYAFGVSLAEIFSGEMPYSRFNGAFKDIHDLAAAVVEGMRPSVIDIPPSLHDLVQRCWSLSPFSRPLANEALAELEQLQSISEWNIRATSSRNPYKCDTNL